MKVKVSGVKQAIINELKTYTNEVMEEIEVEEERIAKEAVQELKSTSPKRYGKYTKGWKKTKDKNGTTVHNSVHQLTHLLEKGHAKTNGGRVEGTPHIAPAEETMIDKYEKAVEKAVNR